MISYKNTIPTPDELYHFYLLMEWEPCLGRTPEELHQAIVGSWRILTVWDDDRLIAMGRVVSDGAISAYICGLGVLAEYRGNGIGRKVFQMLFEETKKHKLILQFFAEESNVAYYNRLGFQVFAFGMKE